MPQTATAVLTPRKTPVQARSIASVDAILDATIQVLLAVGKERLTTTRVALRAGVSVGTLYQYFPNKSSLLQAVLERHMGEVVAAVESVCREQAGGSGDTIAAALVTSYLKAKMRDPRISVALYSVSSDVDGARIVRHVGLRIRKAIATMLASARPPLEGDPQRVATMLQGTIAGVSRGLVESSQPARLLESTRAELILLVCAYLRAHAVQPES